MWMQHTQFTASLPAVHETTLLVGFFVATKTQVLHKVGLLDERFGWGGNDDLDLSIRIRRAGWKLLINRKAFVFHYGSRTLAPVFGGWEGITREDNRTSA
jgi:GT2 family glycosyltransferase